MAEVLVDGVLTLRLFADRYRAAQEGTMGHRLSVTAVGHATSVLLSVAFVLCVGFDLLFPSRAMYESWQALLPGFTWISWPAFLLGVLESYGYGWFVALIWVPVYNAAGRRRGPGPTAETTR